MLSGVNAIKAAEEFLCNEDLSALLVDGMEDAFVGLMYRFHDEPVAAYDRAHCIRILQQDGMTEEEAEEYFEFNIIGAWVGDKTPCFIERFEG